MLTLVCTEEKGRAAARHSLTSRAACDHQDMSEEGHCIAIWMYAGAKTYDAPTSTQIRAFFAIVKVAAAAA